MLKDSAANDLITAVESVGKGTAFFSHAIARVMLEDYVRRLTVADVVDRYDTLTERECEIFQLIVEGHPNKQIADLGISAATVETHRARILQKLDLHTMAELVLYAVRRGVIS